MSHDQKISSFTNQPLFQDTDLITFIRNGTNFNGLFSTLKLSLGVSGTLNPVGSSLGVPVLEQPAAGVNNFRAMEDGAGVSFSVSAENGIIGKTNFAQGSSGSQLIKSLTDKQLLFRSLVAGSDMNIAPTSDGNSLRVSFIGGGASTSTVVISEESDFPVPISGVINLVSGIDYLLTQNITLANRFNVNSSVVRASNSSIVKLTYTGIDTMFTGVDANFKIAKIKVASPNGTTFNMKGTVPGAVFQMDDMTVSECENIGVLDNISAAQITNTAFDEVKTDGISFAGNIPVFILERCVFNQLQGNSLDLGVATFDGITMVTNFVNVSAGANFIKGATLSVNINTGGLGTVFNSRVSGAGASLSGLSSDDALWNFLGNDDIADTRPDGLLSMQSNTTDTVIAIASIPVLIEGTWDIQTTSQMTGTTAGKLTYDGGKDAKIPITASVTLSPVSGGSQILGALIGLNGTPIDDSIVIGEVSAGSEISLTIPWQLNFNKGDFVEIFVTNISTTTDILVTGAISRVN